MKSTILISILVLFTSEHLFAFDDIENKKETERLSEVLLKARSAPKGKKFVLKEQKSRHEDDLEFIFNSEPAQENSNQLKASEGEIDESPDELQN